MGCDAEGGQDSLDMIGDHVFVRVPYQSNPLKKYLNIFFIAVFKWSRDLRAVQEQSRSAQLPHLQG
jgi:hypothetical protein